MRQRIGLHIRLTGSVLELIHKAQRLQLPFFQCFFVLQATGRLIRVSKREVQSFVAARRQHFNDLFFHGSYWINLAGLLSNGYRSLERENRLAKRLAFTHMILHAGTAKGAREKCEGIDALACSLNTLFKTEQSIDVMLENTAHGNLAVGSDILDFQKLLGKIDQPERVSFCIDTAHAYSFGYDIIGDKKQDLFIDFLDNTIGLERIKMIHLNDTKEQLGSCIDRHAVIGEGRIGKKIAQAICFTS